MLRVIYSASLGVLGLLTELRSPLTSGDENTLPFRGIHRFSTYLAHLRKLVKLILK